MAKLKVMEHSKSRTDRRLFYGAVLSHDGEVRLHTTRIAGTRAEARKIAKEWAEDNDLPLSEIAGRVER